jgi:NIMA (never in mitosis gene a)-related kinase
MHCFACFPAVPHQVLKALGKGSYGTVYKVQRLADGEVYAMKETDLGRMGPKERADAVNEIRVLGSMGHPNVVRHHETFLAGGGLGSCCSAAVLLQSSYMKQ